MNVYVQSNQPPGVPPLTLTGERTLPDVPAENYWYRRHLAVYEWIGARVLGARVIDMACGEGYGAEVLSRSAATVVGVDANAEAQVAVFVGGRSLHESDIEWHRARVEQFFNLSQEDRRIIGSAVGHSLAHVSAQE